MWQRGRDDGLIERRQEHGSRMPRMMRRFVKDT